MNRHRSSRYTVLISGSGRAPITLSFQPLIAATALGILVAIPLGAIGWVVYSYAHRNTALHARNEALTQQASSILQRVEALESEINSLQERAGMPGRETPENSEVLEESLEESNDLPRGGVGEAVEAQALLDTANSQLPNLLRNLKRDIQPALEQTLDREAALPKGLPIQRSAKITSTFGLRSNPFGWGYEYHRGLDFAEEYGTPVYVTAIGIVQTADWDAGYGYHVVVDHGYGYQTLYGHLSRLAVKQGDTIFDRQIVGYLGSSGRSSGPHLHYEVHRDGKAVDPKRYID